MNLSACVPGSLASTDAARKRGSWKKTTCVRTIGGGRGPSPLLRLPRGTLALACSPKAGSAGVRAGGRGSHAPHRLLAIGMMRGCCRGFVSWVRCVYARMDC